MATRGPDEATADHDAEASGEEEEEAPEEEEEEEEEEAAAGEPLTAAAAAAAAGGGGAPASSGGAATAPVVAAEPAPPVAASPRERQLLKALGSALVAGGYCDELAQHIVEIRKEREAARKANARQDARRDPPQ